MSEELERLRSELAKHKVTDRERVLRFMAGVEQLLDAGVDKALLRSVMNVAEAFPDVLERIGEEELERRFILLMHRLLRALWPE